MHLVGPKGRLVLLQQAVCMLRHRTNPNGRRARRGVLDQGNSIWASMEAWTQSRARNPAGKSVDSAAGLGLTLSLLESAAFVSCGGQSGIYVPTGCM